MSVDASLPARRAKVEFKEQIRSVEFFGSEILGPTAPSGQFEIRTEPLRANPHLPSKAGAIR
ncbi:hypothetical protein [Paraburkholderia elongata]|uniref:hypothetical protein n=1 Tax=Paraburkholderia elongata TaxID=2675747 RepID=UPI001C131C2C|nr:hypothetical protein [Paraburkholderia elongata]